MVEPQLGVSKLPSTSGDPDWQCSLRLRHLAIGRKKFSSSKYALLTVGRMEYFCALVPVDQGIDTSTPRLLEMSDLYSSAQVEADEYLLLKYWRRRLFRSVTLPICCVILVEISQISNSLVISQTAKSRPSNVYLEPRKYRFLSLSAAQSSHMEVTSPGRKWTLIY